MMVDSKGFLVESFNILMKAIHTLLVATMCEGFCKNGLQENTDKHSPREYDFSPIYLCMYL